VLNDDPRDGGRLMRCSLDVAYVWHGALHGDVIRHRSGCLRLADSHAIVWAKHHFVLKPR